VAFTIHTVQNASVSIALMQTGHIPLTELPESLVL